VDPYCDRLTPPADDAPPGPVRANWSAYIFFTSGSTGAPKGILGKHSGLSHFVEWQRDTFRVGAGDRIAQLASWSFDPLLRELFLPLTSGASLSLPNDDAPPSEALEWLAREAVTIAHIVPSIARTWLETSASETHAWTPRAVFFAGEPLSDALVARWRQRVPGSQIVNLYGPTETCMAKCAYVVPERPAAGIMPIGRPLPGAQILVLKRADQLCGIHEAGELAIRTAFGTNGTSPAPTRLTRIDSFPTRFVPIRGMSSIERATWAAIATMGSSKSSGGSTTR
jgi:non-ribosomal peptide synthetase component F